MPRPEPHPYTPHPHLVGYCACNLPARHQSHHTQPPIPQQRRTQKEIEEFTMKPSRDARKNAGEYARDAILSTLDETSPEAQKKAIHSAINTQIRKGTPFSANTIRDILGPVNKNLIGAVFMSLSRRGEIRRIGDTPSTDTATHAHRIGLWTGTQQEVSA